MKDGKITPGGTFLGKPHTTAAVDEESRVGFALS